MVAAASFKARRAATWRLVRSDPTFTQKKSSTDYWAARHRYMTEEVVNYLGVARKVVSDTVVKADFDTIPLISVKALYENDPTSKQTLVDQIRDACQRVGFFYIKDHGIQGLDELFEEAKRFFALPLEDKMEVHHLKSPIFRGFEPVSNQGEELSKPGDNKEAFNWGYEPAADPLYASEPSLPSLPAGPMSGDNVWPSAQPSLKPALFAYYGQVLVLARRLIQILSLALNLPENYFDQHLKMPGCLGRLLHYPAQDPNSSNLGIGAHSDIECLTFLAQGPDLSCLQVLNKDGQWIEAPPIPGTLVVNLGDMLARWTHGQFLSTVHRVINRTGRERYSIPIFFGVSYDSMIETLPTCLAAGEESKFPPISAGEYVWRRLARSRLNLKYEQTSIKDRDAHVVKAAA